MTREPIRFDRSVCADLDAARNKEWLETNGLGGFASSTIVGLNTRRYNGLLMAATKPPAGRMLLLAKLEETLILAGEKYDLSVNCYPGAIYPQGHKFLKEFRLDPFPIFTYQVGAVELEKRVFMRQGENATVIEYELHGDPSGCLLEIRPLIAFRDYHGATHWNNALNRTVTRAPGQASVTPYAGLPTLHLAHNASALQESGDWYYSFEYEVERERGLDYREDLFNPFVLTFDLGRQQTAVVIASTEPHEAIEAPSIRRAEIERRAAQLSSAPSPDPLIQDLTAAARQFIVKRGDLTTIIAGYPWFCDWGRDTMISLTGLTLVTGQLEVAKNILRAFARSVSQGMLPNRFADLGETPDYNTADATLWFFDAIRSLLKYAGEQSFVQRELYPVLKDILDWHIRGTRYGIRVDSDGLLTCGEPGVQLTWMDAKVGDWVVTPRYGKPVEIQALWYNALRITEALARLYGEAEREAACRRLAERARASFLAQFWREDAGCLYDVVNGGLRDAAIRPNQIFAVSLTNSMLDDTQAAKVVDVCRQELLTPMGLRSLSPRDPQYHPRYEGNQVSRDSAYHQGTVWPWLLGPFVTAYIKVNGGSPESRAQAAEWLSGFKQHLTTAGLGQISEVADGDPPHRPGGCFAQAWSVAELLRAAVEDVYGSAF